MEDHCREDEKSPPQILEEVLGNELRPENGWSGGGRGRQEAVVGCGLVEVAR